MWRDVFITGIEPFNKVIQDIDGSDIYSPIWMKPCKGLDFFGR